MVIILRQEIYRQASPSTRMFYFSLFQCRIKDLSYPFETEMDWGLIKYARSSAALVAR